MRRTSGYGNYRGRATVTDVLRTIALILLVLVILAAAVLFYGQKYIVRGEDGQIRVEFPFFQAPREPVPTPDSSPDPVPSSAPVGDQSSQPTPDPKPVPQEEKPLRALYVPIDSVLLGTLSSQAEEAGANAVILDMKTDQGLLNFVSQQPIALEREVNSDLPDINQHLRQAAQDDNLYLIARLSCFRDHQVGKHSDYAIITNSGWCWKDVDGYAGLHWISPSRPAVRAYVAGLAKELAELGFDEILLDYCGYPRSSQGPLGFIRPGADYNAEALSRNMDLFFQELSAALEGSGVRVSVRTWANVLEGSETSTGQTVSQLEQYASRIYMYLPEDGSGGTQRLTLAGISDAQNRLVELVSQFDSGKERNRAVLSVS